MCTEKEVPFIFYQNPYISEICLINQNKITSTFLRENIQVRLFIGTFMKNGGGGGGGVSTPWKKGWVVGEIVVGVFFVKSFL